MASGISSAAANHAANKQADVNASAQAQHGYAAYTAPQPEQSQPQQPARRGLIQDTMEWGIPYNNAHGRFQSIYSAMVELVKSYPTLAADKDSWTFLSFDGPANNAIVSAVLFVRCAGDLATVFPLVVPETSDLLQDRTFNGMMPLTANGGYVQSISVPQLPEELLTSEGDLAQMIEDFVVQSLAVKGIKRAIVSGGRVLPQELTAENKAQLDRIMFYANSCLMSVIATYTNTQPVFSLTDRLDPEGLLLTFDYNSGQVADGTGMPVRSDLAITLSLADKQNDGNNYNYNGRRSLGRLKQRVFSNVNGYMSLAWKPTQQQYGIPAGMPYNAMMMPPMPMYLPIFIISRMDNAFGRATLETQLLALATASSLTQQNIWSECFRPNHMIREPGTDPRDIGNITIAANYPGEESGFATDTKANDFNLQAFLTKYLHKELLIQIDVPELGDMTYLQSVFLDAAGVSRNAEIQQKANEALFQAANRLTGGHFATAWSKYGNQPFVTNEVGRVELGHYLNEKGELRDLAEIDFLSLLVKADKEQANAYQDSLNPAMGPEIARFQVRQNIYANFFSTYKITGYARRLTINPNFLMALGEALLAVGGTIKMVHNHQYAGQSFDRTYHNQVLGIPLNGVAGFVQGYANNMGGFNNGSMGGVPTWSNYHTQSVPWYNTFGTMNQAQPMAGNQMGYAGAQPFANGVGTPYGR